MNLTNTTGMSHLKIKNLPTSVLAELTDKIGKRYEHAILIRIQWLAFALLNISLQITEGYKPSRGM